jgi:hypothetical protein
MLNFSHTTCKIHQKILLLLPLSISRMWPWLPFSCFHSDSVTIVCHLHKCSFSSLRASTPVPKTSSQWFSAQNLGMVPLSQRVKCKVPAEACKHLCDWFVTLLAYPPLSSHLCAIPFSYGGLLVLPATVSLARLLLLAADLSLTFIWLVPVLVRFKQNQ